MGVTIPSWSDHTWHSTVPWRSFAEGPACIGGQHCGFITPVRNLSEPLLLTADWYLTGERGMVCVTRTWKLPFFLLFHLAVFLVHHLSMSKGYKQNIWLKLLLTSEWWLVLIKNKSKWNDTRNKQEKRVKQPRQTHQWKLKWLKQVKPMWANFKQAALGVIQANWSAIEAFMAYLYSLEWFLFGLHQSYIFCTLIDWQKQMNLSASKHKLVTSTINNPHVQARYNLKINSVPHCFLLDDHCCQLDHSRNDKRNMICTNSRILISLTLDFSNKELILFPSKSWY